MYIQNHPASKELNLIKSIAGIMDSKFTIPGTKIKFGIDPILGLIPGFGVISTSVISLFLVYTIGKHGVSGKVIILMLLNILVDTILSSIPLLGNIADIFYRSNNKNIELLINHYELGKHQSNGLPILLMLLVLIISIIITLAFGLFKLLEFITIYLGF